MRTKILGLSLTLALLLPVSNSQAGEILPLAVDLQKTAKTAEKHNIPVVVFFTATWCNYCKKLEENILHPLLETTNIENYAEFRQIIMDKAHWQMKDFSGNDIEMKTFAPSQKVIVAPTTYVYNSQGELIAEPILGLTLEEFYPGNLEKAINQGLKALGNEKRLDIYKMVEESKIKY
ncbi:thioredoxin fold domain-containing protein [Thiomicrorhabdus sp. Kp2]|uniref:thioredoxin fold domain-containing protein n=1 Tax=Thiomicrorhabdus sp. Kp2 TaxID=1123518 RepID=UPI000400F027|nr:thioredoxin fold domain-containing protein [Thiomicrorhabdus sp. Kp2]